MTVFDRWRAAYDELTPAGHALVAELMATIWPRQRHYHVRSVIDFLLRTQPLRVAEFGGYDGALAREALRACSWVQRWTNHDIVEVEQVCTDPRYTLGTLSEADALVACHSFEHVRAVEAARAVQQANAPFVYIDAPLPQQAPVNWAGYGGTHILELSWEGLGWAMADQGYEEFARWETTKSHARAYRRAA